MLSELALVDWVALLIALALLGVAGVATYLAHSTEGTGVFSVQPNQESSGYKPSHARSGATGMAAHPSAAGFHAQISLPNDAVKPPNSISKPTNSISPPPPPLKVESFQTLPSPPVGRASGPDDVIDLTSDREETVSERAQRLRNRPLAEDQPPKQAIVDAPEPLTFQAALVAPRIERNPRPGLPPRDPGFFADPVGRHELRYWNGAKWTEYVKEGVDRFIDPL